MTERGGGVGEEAHTDVFKSDSRAGCRAGAFGKLEVSGNTG